MLFLFLAGCTKARTGIDAAPEERTISIQYLKSLYAGYPLFISADYTVEGMVVSSDKWGNFRRSIIIEDATGGIEVKLDMEDIFARFLLGQTVRVSCAGLTLGDYGGALQLGEAGGASGYECSPVAASRIGDHITSTGSPRAPEPTVLLPHQLSARYVGCLVKFRGVQFSDEDAGHSWGGEEPYTDRTLIFPSGGSVSVSTSSRADFAPYILPAGSGDIEGVLCTFNRQYFLRVNSDDFLLMDSPRFDY